MGCAFVKAPRIEHLKWVILFYVNYTLIKLVKNKSLVVPVLRVKDFTRVCRPQKSQCAYTSPVSSSLYLFIL